MPSKCQLLTRSASPIQGITQPKARSAQLPWPSPSLYRAKPVKIMNRLPRVLNRSMASWARGAWPASAGASRRRKR